MNQISKEKHIYLSFFFNVLEPSCPAQNVLPSLSPFEMRIPYENIVYCTAKAFGQRADHRCSGGKLFINFKISNLRTDPVDSTFIEDV